MTPPPLTSPLTEQGRAATDHEPEERHYLPILRGIALGNSSRLACCRKALSIAPTASIPIDSAYSLSQRYQLGRPFTANSVFGVSSGSTGFAFGLAMSSISSTASPPSSALGMMLPPRNLRGKHCEIVQVRDRAEKKTGRVPERS